MPQVPLHLYSMERLLSLCQPQVTRGANGEFVVDNLEELAANLLNSLIVDFLKDLLLVDPDNVTVHNGVTVMEHFMKHDPKEPLKRWLKSTETHQHALQDRNPDSEKYFLAHAHEIEYIKQLDIATLYPTLHEDDRASIWNHIITINSMAMLLAKIDLKNNPQVQQILMKSASSVATRMSQRNNLFKGNQPTAEEQATILRSVQGSVMKEMMGNKELMGLFLQQAGLVPAAAVTGSSAPAGNKK